MIQFPEIWAKYKRGELKRLEPVQSSEKEKTGFNDLDTHGKLIREITSFETKPLMKTLANQSVSEPDIDKLEDILSKIEVSERNMWTKEGSSVLHGHFIRAIRLGDNYDQFILRTEENTYDQFNINYISLEKGNNPKYVQDMREKTDNSFQTISAIHNIAKRREILGEIPGTHKERVLAYAQIKSNVDAVKNEIDSLKEEYSRCEFNKTGIKDIQSLQKRIKNFWGKGLLKESKKINFIEGAEDLKELYEEMEGAKKNPSKYQALRRLGNKKPEEVVKSKENGPKHPQQETTQENQNQEYERRKNIGVYSLSMHMFTIEYPKNFQYFPLRSALTEQGNWDDKFSNFNKQLKYLLESEATTPINEEDKLYLKSVAEGIYLATEKPEKGFPVQKAKKTYETLQTIIS